MRKAFCLFVLAPFLAAGTGLAAQEPPPAPSSIHDVLLLLNVAGKMVIELAEDFPEEKYDYKPTPEVRSFAEQLLHIAGSNYLFSDIARGQQPAAGDFSRERYKTKADVVAVLKKSFEDLVALIRERGEAAMTERVKTPMGMLSQYAMWIMAVAHAREHYGNLVVYYRVNGLVPPASRPRR